MFAFVDETGNTGGNLLDEKQPDFFTAALITKSNFDIVYAPAITAMAAKFGGGALHGKDLGFGRVETIAGQLHTVFKKADARFFISRVEKRYLLASKIFDTFFDSGENAAVPWSIYNLRPLRLMLCFKVATLITEELGTRFWNMLMEKNERKAIAALSGICQSIIDRVDRLPDQRSRQLVSEALGWAHDHPETIHVHIDKRQARNGHMPNMVAFANLLDGLEFFSKKWDRKVRRITHHRQSQFEATLKEWHELYSFGPAEPIKWADETIVFQKVVGSEFEVKSEDESAGIQAVDIVLWVYLQFVRKGQFPRECARLINYAFRHAWINDFSFAGVDEQIERRFGAILRTPLTPEQEAEARKLIELDEQRRLESMKQYERDGVVPYMRRPATVPTTEVTDSPSVPIGQPCPANRGQLSGTE